MRVVLLIPLILFISPAAQAETQAIPAAYALTVQDAERAVAEALVASGAHERVKASLQGVRGTVLQESAQPLAIAVKTLQFDKPTRSWSANLFIMSGEAVLKAIPAAGRFQEMAALPVLKRQMRNGEVMSEADFDVQEFPLSYVRPGVVADVAQLVGRTPRSMISPQRPVRETEISTPSVVKKNASVQMVYRMANMEISASGQALAAGAKGDVIEVRNMTSKQVVRAVVEDETHVSIMPITGVQSQAQTPALAPAAGSDHAAN